MVTSLLQNRAAYINVRVTAIYLRPWHTHSLLYNPLVATLYFLLPQTFIKHKFQLLFQSLPPFRSYLKTNKKRQWISKLYTLKQYSVNVYYKAMKIVGMGTDCGHSEVKRDISVGQWRFWVVSELHFGRSLYQRNHRCVD